MPTPIQINLPVTINVPDSVPAEQAGAWVLARVRAYAAHYAGRAGLPSEEAPEVTVEAIAQRAIDAGVTDFGSAYLHPVVAGPDLAAIDSLGAAVPILKSVLASLVGEAIVAQAKRHDETIARLRADAAYSAAGLIG